MSQRNEQVRLMFKGKQVFEEQICSINSNEVCAPFYSQHSAPGEYYFRLFFSNATNKT